MPKIKFLRLISLGYLVSLFLFGVAGFSNPPQPQIRLSTTPSLSQLTPYEAEAEAEQSPPQLTLQAVDPLGQPLKNANIQLEIFTPAKTPWLTTDFPIVEGTKLLAISTSAPEGKLQVQPMLPIRGTYQLQVKVTPQTENAFKPFAETLNLTLAENRIKLQNFAIWATMFMIIGGLGGWIIGKRRASQPGEMAPAPVRLLLSGAAIAALLALLFVNISAEMTQSGMSMPMSHLSEMPVAAEASATQQQGDITLTLSGNTHAVVGQPANLQVSLRNTRTQRPISGVQVKITATQLEDNWLALGYQGVLAESGDLKWQQQFFDGAPHQVVAEVKPLPGSDQTFKAFQVSQLVGVEGVAPPLSVRLISLAYFTGIIGIAFGLGFWLRRLFPRF